LDGTAIDSTEQGRERGKGKGGAMDNAEVMIRETEDGRKGQSVIRL
jgi:hypothetical protein